MNISVFGAGYVGLVTAVCFAEIGHRVNIFDIDKNKINSLNKGKIPIYEPGLEDLFKKNLDAKRVSIEANLNNALDFSDIYFICVGTPQFKNGKPNLNYLYNVCRSIKKFINKKNVITDKYLVLKSTIPPGTTNKIRSLVFGDQKFKNLHIGSNPEFLREGHAVFDFMNSDRIVIGSDSQKLVAKVSKIYNLLKSSAKILVTDPQSSELIKYGSNAFLATKISFINELSRLSDKVGGNIDEISLGLGLDKRIGNSFLNAGLGYGGSCFPKDTMGLAASFLDNKIPSEIIQSVIKVNKTQKDYFIHKILKRFSKQELKKKSVLILGTAFKPNTDDIRESVSIEVIRKISSMVKEIYIFEPIARKNSADELSSLENIKFQTSKKPKISKFHDFLIVATEYPEFKELPINDFLNLRDKLVFDGRNILNMNKLSKAGIEYIGIGKQLRENIG